MQNTSRFSLPKLLWRRPLPSPSRPVSPIPLNSLPQAARNFVAFQNPNFSSSEFYFFPPQAQFTGYQNPRNYTTESGAESGTNADIKGIGEETGYFDEEEKCPKTVVKEAMEKYEALMAKLSESEKAALHRSLGGTIEQLKADHKQFEMEDK